MLGLGRLHALVMQEAAHGVVVLAAGIAQVVDHEGRITQESLHLGPLVVEHPQRVHRRALPGRRVEVEGAEELLQERAVGGPAGGTAE